MAELPEDAAYLDATADGSITPRDALAVVNGVNDLAASESIDDAIEGIAHDVASALDDEAA